MKLPALFRYFCLVTVLVDKSNEILSKWLANWKKILKMYTSYSLAGVCLMLNVSYWTWSHTMICLSSDKLLKQWIFVMMLVMVARNCMLQLQRASHLVPLFFCFVWQRSLGTQRTSLWCAGGSSGWRMALCFSTSTTRMAALTSLSQLKTLRTILQRRSSASCTSLSW